MVSPIIPTPRAYSLPLVPAEQERRDVRYARRLRHREWRRAADGERRKTDPGGEQAVHHALAHARRDARGESVANELLEDAVADRHAAGDCEMRADGPTELEEAEKPGPPAVDFGDAAHEADDLGDDENDVENGARADRGHERHSL